MSESIFTSIIEEWADRDWASYDNAPVFKTSKRHDRAMRRIFRRCERNTRKFRPHQNVSIRHIGRKVTIAVLVIILAVLAGCAVSQIITQSFTSLIIGRYTHLYLIDKNNSDAENIKEIYYFPELPEGFELVFSAPDLLAPVKKEDEAKPDQIAAYRVVNRYENKQTGQTIHLYQISKSVFGSVYFITEESDLDEFVINGHSGAIFKRWRDYGIENTVVWDNGDYVIELNGNLDKNDLLNLARSIKLSEEEIVARQN